MLLLIFGEEKEKKLTYMSFWQAYWYHGWLNMVDWIVIILPLLKKSIKKSTESVRNMTDSVLFNTVCIIFAKIK